jgi:hypothetical protein
MVFSEEFRVKLADHLADRFCLLTVNAAEVVIALRHAFVHGRGLLHLRLMMTNSEFLSQRPDFVASILNDQNLAKGEGESKRLISGFSRYFFVRLPTVLNSKIRSRGQPTAEEISYISKVAFVRFSKLYPDLAEAEIAKGLFEEFSSVVRDVKKHRFYGKSRSDSFHFRYRHEWLFACLSRFPSEVSSQIANCDIDQPIAAIVDKFHAEDRDVLFALAIRDCFPIFLNCLEGDYAEAVMSHPLSGVTAFR